MRYRKALMAFSAGIIICMTNPLGNSAKGSEDSYTSYNPTEPEVQLGYTKVQNMSIDDSGTLTLDSQNVQGSLDKNGDVYIDAVKRPKIFRYDDGDKLTLYYILDKSGDIFSINLKMDKYLEDKEGNRVNIRLVDSIEGTNGVADGDGFKSNLVPEKFLPKTGLVEDVQEHTQNITGQDKESVNITILSTISILIISLFIFAVEIIIKAKYRKGDR